MAFSQLQLTNAGTRELAKGGALVLTKIALGDGQMGDVATASGLARKVCEVTPTVTSDNEYQVIEGVFDNIALDITAEKNIQEVGVFGKVGEGADVLLYYAKGNAFVFPPKTQQQMTVKIPFRVKIVGNREVTVSLNTQISGMATADSVNRVSETLGKLKSDSPEELAKALNVTSVADLMGTLVTEAPLDLDNLSTPGMYFFNDKHKATAKGINSNFGFLIVASNKKGALGTSGHFTWQVFITTSGNAFIRYRINTNQWMVSAIANGTYFTSLLSRLGLDEWAASIKLKECPSGSDLGAFISSRDIPVGLNIIRDHNAPVKDVFVWKINGAIAKMFSPGPNGSFLVNSIDNGRIGTWRDLSQPQAPLVSTGQFAAYLRSSAVPAGSVPVKDSTTGAFGTVTKIDNNNIYFTGALREQGKTYQVAYAIVDGVVPNAFTKWALT